MNFKPDVEDPNPFPGLRAFEAAEGHLFFGREGQSEDILRALRRSRLLTIVGASGSGKSSLIRAGLLPAIHGGFLKQAGSHWRVALLRPGGDPIGALSRALIDQSVLEPMPAEPEEVQRRNQLTAAYLRRSGLGLVEAVRLARLPSDENILIVVDQFEELFRFGRATGASVAADDAAAFVKLILEATRQDKLPIYVCLTMRSDFIGECARFRDLPEAVTAGLYLIPRMTRVQRRAAIEEPVRVGGGHITPRLVNRILNDVGDDPDQLPIMQHALMRAWDHWQAAGDKTRPIDLLDYEAIGGTSGALSMHADEAFESLDEAGKTVARKIFQCLTEKDADNREARRPTMLSSLAEVAESTIDEVMKIVNVFRVSGRSFLMPPTQLEPATVIDISHESLIRGWKRLRAWVEQETESAQVYERLADTAALHAAGQAGLWRDPDLAVALAWREREQPNESWSHRYRGDWQAATAFLEVSRTARDAEMRSARLRQRITAAAAVVFLVVAAAAVVEGMKAQESANEAAAQRDRAQQQTKLAEAQAQIAQKNEADAKHAQEIGDSAFKQTIAEVLHFAAQFNLAGKYDLALDELKDWEDVVRDYTRSNPRNPFWLQQIGYLKDQTAAVLIEKSDYQRALTLGWQSKNIFLGIVTEDPANARYRADLLNNRGQIARTLVKLTRRPEALEELWSAKKMEVELPPDGSRLPALRDALASVDLSLGSELLAASRGEEAQGAFGEARSLWKELIAENPKKITWLRQMAEVSTKSGDAFWGRQQFADANAMFVDALKANRAVASLDANNVSYAIAVVESRLKTGSVLAKLEKPDEALTAFNETLSMIAEDSAKWPKESYWQRASTFARQKIDGITASQNKPAQ